MRGEGIYASNVRAYMHSAYNNLQDEVPCRKKSDDSRVTRYCDLYDETKDTAYEIKSCRRDLESGYGLNWIGKYNYLICPPDLVIRAAEYLDSLGKDFVGIIAMDVSDSIEAREPLWASMPFWFYNIMTIRKAKETY